MDTARIHSIDDLPAGDNRPSVYWEEIDGQVFLIIRASAIGHPCLWELTAQGQGHDQGNMPAFMRRAFKKGQELEPVVLRRLHDEYGYREFTAQMEGHLILPENIMIRYHPDGIGQFMDPPHDWLGPLVVEVKALRHENYEKAAQGHVGDVVKEYPWQLSVMMHAEKLPGMWVAIDKGWPPDPETEIKPKCEGEGRLYLDPVPTPPISLKEITEKALKIKELVLGEDVLTADWGCTSPDHFPCRYQHLRPEPEEREDDGWGDKGEGGVGKVVHLDSDSEEGREFDQMVRDYILHHGHAKEAKDRADALKEKIIAYTGIGTEKVITDKFAVPIRTNTTSKIHWDQMPPELKEKLQQYIEKKKTAPFIQNVKGLE
jgi:hypothetical protein